MSLPGRAKQRDRVMAILPKEAAAAQKPRKFMLHRNNAGRHSDKSYAFTMPGAAIRH
jgi:hypothetical protein